MEILLYKINEELLFLDKIKKKITAFAKIENYVLNNLLNDWLFTLAFFNKQNDFSIYPRIDLKNKNYNSLIGNLLHLIDTPRNAEEIINFIEKEIEIDNKKYNLEIQKYIADKNHFNLDKLQDEIILYFENKDISFHQNFIVKHLIEEAVPIENIVYNFAICNLFTDDSNLTLSKTIQYQLYDLYNVKYQAFGNPFLSLFAMLDDCYFSSAFDLELENGLPNFLELNLNCYTKGNWLIMMPTTQKEFDKVFRKIESFLHNERKVIFYLVYPAWEYLNIDSPYVKEKKVTSDISFQSNKKNCIITKKDKFNVVTVCYKLLKKMTIF
ncbi:hypothetical protein AL387_gp129 [Carp edema virus]|nr:hypothetical protein AL387_gp129 [Carp edema virus]